MAKKVVIRVDRNLARRLRDARRETGLSVRAACAKLPRGLAVSHTTLTSYENGITTPPVGVLAALADLYSRPLNWFLEHRETLTGFRYRNLKDRSPLAERRHFEAQAAKWAEAYFRLDRFLAIPRKRCLTVPESDIVLPPAELAISVRRNVLGLHDGDRIDNVVSVLESFSAWALEVKTALGIDGAAARHGNNTVVIFNRDTPNDRLRMVAAHELAHVLYQGQPALSTDAVERRAYDFATALLFPHSQLVEAFKHKSLLKLFEYKERFGVSLAAMIHMAERTRLISTTVSRSLWSEVVRLRWQHNEPGFVWRDRAISFEMMLDSAIRMKRITWEDAERATGVCVDELRQRIAVLYEDAGAHPNTDQHQATLGIPHLSLFAIADEGMTEA